MNFSYGFVETRGFIAAIEATDAMLKAAMVEVVSRRKAGGALVMIVVKGRLDACRAAVDAGSAAADRIGELVSAHVIPNPYDDTEQLVSQFLGGRKKQKQAKEKTSEQPAPQPAEIKKQSRAKQKTIVPKNEVKKEKPRTKPKKADPFSPQEKLLNHIKAAPKGITLTQLADKFGKPAAEIRVLLKKLMDRGVVEKVQKKYFLINGRPGK